MSSNTIKNHHGKSREILKSYPYYFFFFLSFHEEFWRTLSPRGSFILNVKDKVVDGQRNRYVWKTIMALNGKGWISVDDYIWYKPNAMPGYWPNRLRDEREYCVD